MTRFLIFKPRKVVLYLLLLWLIVSAFYYAEHLFSPNFYMGYEEGTLHKVVKYVACLILSIFFCVLARAYTLLLFCTLILLLGSLFALNHSELDIAVISMMVVGTMLSFILVPALWESRLLQIGQVVVVCGAIVGVFSIIEFTLLTTLFESAWASTGSIRSVSTLFNPNNLGLYVGVALVLLPYMKLRTAWTAICGALLVFSLVASGSRTAWVSLALVFVYAITVSSEARARLAVLMRRRRSLLLLSGIALLVVYGVYRTFSAPPEIEITARGADLYTANIRWENFLSFIDLIDMSLLFPDWKGIRAEFIQDNFYLVILNSFGLVGVALLLAFLTVHFSSWRSTQANLTPWKLVFMFFMISGLSGSQLNSFPNNQLFFLSMGSILIYRPHPFRSRYAQAQPHLYYQDSVGR